MKGCCPHSPSSVRAQQLEEHLPKIHRAWVRSQTSLLSGEAAAFGCSAGGTLSTSVEAVPLGRKAGKNHWATTGLLGACLRFWALSKETRQRNAFLKGLVIQRGCEMNAFLWGEENQKESLCMLYHCKEVTHLRLFLRWVLLEDFNSFALCINLCLLAANLSCASLTL